MLSANINAPQYLSVRTESHKWILQINIFSISGTKAFNLLKRGIILKLRHTIKRCLNVFNKFIKQSLWYYVVLHKCPQALMTCVAMINGQDECTSFMEVLPFPSLAMSFLAAVSLPLLTATRLNVLEMRFTNNRKLVPVPWLPLTLGLCLQFWSLTCSPVCLSFCFCCRAVLTAFWASGLPTVRIPSWFQTVCPLFDPHTFVPPSALWVEPAF